MGNGQQQPSDDQLDVVQHPTLGTLKFPKDMPIAQRNSSIESLELSDPATMDARAHKQATPAPKTLPNTPDEPSPFGGGNAQDAAIMKEAQKNYPNVTSPKTIGAVAGSTLLPAALPAMGVAGTAAAVGAGAAAGHAAGTAATGENPVSKESLTDAAKTGLAYGGGALTAGGLGAVGKYALPRLFPQIASRLGMDILEPTYSLYRRAVAPTALTAEEEGPMAEQWARAAKYIAPKMKGAPLKPGKTGAMDASNIVQYAKQELYENVVEPIVQNYSHIMRPVTDVADAGRATVDMLTRDTKPATVKAVDRLVKPYEGPMTVGELNDRIQELNGDKAVSRYHNMGASEQTDALRADPALKAKVAVLDAARNKLFDIIGADDVGGRELGNRFQDARKDYGALSSVQQNIRQAQITPPSGPLDKVLNSTRAVFSTTGVHAFGKPSASLFDLENPNRLLVKAFNQLGKSGLTAPEAVGKVAPFTPTNRMLPGPGLTGPGSTFDPSLQGGVRGNLPLKPGQAGPPVPAGASESGVVPGGPRNVVEPIQLGHMHKTGLPARIPGRPYLEGTTAPTPAGTATPSPSSFSNEERGSIPFSGTQAEMRAKLRAVIDDPNATSLQKSKAANDLRKLKGTTTGAGRRGVPAPPP